MSIIHGLIALGLGFLVGLAIRELWRSVRTFLVVLRVHDEGAETPYGTFQDDDHIWGQGDE